MAILCLCFAGCVKYHSKSSDAPKTPRNNVPVNEDTRDEAPFVDYDYGDFEKVVADDDCDIKNVYHVKVVRILL